MIGSVELTGYVAGFLLLVSLVPQVIKSWQTKSTKDLSLARYSIYTCGLVLMTYYGWLITSWPLFFMTLIEVMLALSILYLKLKNDAHLF